MTVIIKEECRTVQLFEENKTLAQAHRAIRRTKNYSDPWKTIEQLRQISLDALGKILGYHR